MAGYGSGDDWDYYSDGGWGGEQDDGDYHSDNHWDWNDFADYDNVDGEHCYEEQDNGEMPFDHLDHDNRDCYSDGGCGGEQDDGQYYSDNHCDWNDFADYENVDGEHCYRGQDDDEMPFDHLEDLDNVIGSYEGTDSERSYYEERDHDDEIPYEGYYEETDSDDYYYEEQDNNDDKTSDDEYQGAELEESDDEPEGHLVGNGAAHYPQQTMTRGIANNQEDGGGRLVTSYQWSSRIRHQDKQTGSYELRNAKHTFSSGDIFKERSTGRVGFKDEHKLSSTVRIGDRSGYLEHQLEERFRNVRFGESSGSGSNGDGHRRTYNNYKKY